MDFYTGFDYSSLIPNQSEYNSSEWLLIIKAQNDVCRAFKSEFCELINNPWFMHTMIIYPTNDLIKIWILRFGGSNKLQYCVRCHQIVIVIGIAFDMI